ncbi:NUDIX hydrolase [Phreatobacter stygius]|uniref:NUDIX hydrolase n=1 Tax=Phreatobacter stygius TaxID=1940610 RepID=A0A4D7BDR0_9HYPH|nr:NUDIX hydrolase [Phreatobacter stygius]QCI66087.1 NUDIX hydrolase [Phreatobacter stygius]
MTAPFRFIRTLETEVSPARWTYAETHAEAIRSAWRRWTADQPAMFNGRVLLLVEGAAEGDLFRGRYIAVDFAEFLHFMRLGQADGSTRNAFALAGLTSADDCLLMGVMAAHTANAGKIYFPGGTPDLSDVVDGRVDLEGSLRRELTEETGLGLDEVTIEAGFWLYEDDKRLAFLKVVRSGLDAEPLRALILDRIGRDEKPELADIHVVRSRADLRPDLMPAFQLAYAEWWLARRGAGRTG